MRNLLQLTILFLAILAVVSSAFAAAERASGFNPMHDSSSPKTVETADLELQDSVRGKTVPVFVTYAAGKAKMPVIVFSHGLGGARDGYSYLARYWAQHGYLVLQPSHEDSIKWNRERKKRVSALAAIRDLPTAKAAWIDRAQDVKFVIENLHTIESRIEGLRNRVNASQIGVAGHSYGAFTSQLIAGAELPHRELAPSDVSLIDHRVKAIVAISPQGVRKDDESFGFDGSDSFLHLRLPAMFVTGDRDNSGWNSAEMRKDAFDFSPSGAKYFVSINGANHMTFAGLTEDYGNAGRYGEMIWNRMGATQFHEPYGDESEHRQHVKRITTLFWNAYIRDDDDALAQLQSKEYSKSINRAGVFETR